MMNSNAVSNGSRRLSDAGKSLALVVSLTFIAASPASAVYRDLTQTGTGGDVSLSTRSADIDLGYARAGGGLVAVRREERLSIRLDEIVHAGEANLSRLGRRGRTLVAVGGETPTTEAGGDPASEIAGLLSGLFSNGAGGRSNYAVAGIEVPLVPGSGGTPSESPVVSPPVDQQFPVLPPAVTPVTPGPVVVNPVPEPSAALLFAAGLGIASLRGRRSA